jgi:hypothetical protein
MRVVVACRFHVDMDFVVFAVTATRVVEMLENHIAHFAVLRAVPSDTPVCLLAPE